jgi:hypothetical protein
MMKRVRAVPVRRVEQETWHDDDGDDGDDDDDDDDEEEEEKGGLTPTKAETEQRRLLACPLALFQSVRIITQVHPWCTSTPGAQPIGFG